MITALLLINAGKNGSDCRFGHCGGGLYALPFRAGMAEKNIFAGKSASMDAGFVYRM